MGFIIAIGSRINERLQVINGSKDIKEEKQNREVRRPRDGEGRPAGVADGENGRPDQRRRRRGMENLSEEEREKMRARYRNMTPEERSRLREGRRGRGGGN